MADFIKWNFFSKPFNFYDYIKKNNWFLENSIFKNANFLETQTIFKKMSLKKSQFK